MGAGLLAGLGRGIAAAGDIYGRGIMQQAMKREEDERQEARELAREGRADEREIAREKRKTEAEEARAEGLKQRVIKDTQAAQTRAGEIASERNATALDKLEESSQQAGADGDMPLSKEQLQSAVKRSPELGRQYKDMGLIKSDYALTPQEARLQKAHDTADAALQIGAHSSVIDAFSKKRESVLAEIKQENADKVAEHRLLQTDQRNAETERSNQANEAIRSKQVGAMLAKIAGGSDGRSGGSDTGERTDAYVKSQKITNINSALKANQGEIVAVIGGTPENLASTIATLARRAKNGSEKTKADAQRQLDAVKPLLENARQLNSQMMSLVKDAPESAAKPPVNTENKSTPTVVAPPVKAIEALRSNPQLVADFDAKYGKGAAQKYLRK